MKKLMFFYNQKSRPEKSCNKNHCENRIINYNYSIRPKTTIYCIIQRNTNNDIFYFYNH